jgi:Tol biopolymer transport system component
VSPFFGVKWSPDSQRVAYLSRDQANVPYLLHVGDDVVTTTDAVSFTWRDDSQAIAYVATQPVTAVYVTSMTGNPQRLAANFAGPPQLQFAPHNTTLAFAAATTGDSLHALWIADTAIAGVATRVQDSVEEFAWSPDGTKLAYGTGTRLELVTPGSAPVVLAEHAEKVSAVQWSSDGQWLAYLVGDDAAFGFWSVYVLRADGASQPQLASGSTNAALASLAFSPTQPVLAYTPYNDSDRALYFIDLASGTPSLIQVSTAGQRPAQFGQAWSPDGTKLVYALDGNGFPQPPPTAFMVDATTLPPPAPLAIADGYEAVSFLWSPDSKNLLAHYRVQLPDGATIYQFGRVVTGGLQPLDDVSRTAHCARWR